MTNVLLRPARLYDAAAVAAFLGGALPEPASGEVLRRHWTAPGMDLERDVVLAASDGRITGYADVDDVEERHERFFSGVFGQPLPALLDWAEQRVREAAVPGARHLYGPWSELADVTAALEERGFRLVRHSYRMTIGLAAEPDEPSWPPGVELRAFRSEDERAVYEAHMETFEDSWEHVHASYEEWAHWMLDDTLDPSLWFLAWAGGELAGIALTRRHRTLESAGWIQILGVRRPWRRRGLARALLLHAFRELRARGLERAALGVDADSLTGAHLLYESVGMQVAHRFDFYEKVVA